MEKVKGFKTIIFAALVALSGFLASPEVAAWAAENAAWVSTGLGAAIAALRAITSGPMFKKD